MIALQNRHRFLIIAFALITIGIIATEFFITHSSAFYRDANLMSFAITFDLVVIVPALFYFLMVRPLQLKWTSILPIYGLAAGVVYFILPKTQHFYLNYVWESMALVEIGVAVWTVSKIRCIIKTYKMLSIRSFDFFINLKKSLEAAIGNTLFARVFATEITTIRYGLLFFIQNKIEIMPHQKAFFGHKKSGYIAIWCVLLFVGFVELFAMHFLFKRFGNTVVIIADVLSIYALVFFVADLVALLRRPILIDNQHLTVRVGMRWHTLIDRDTIEKIESINRLPANKDIVKIINMGEPNVLLTLKETVHITGLYGIKRESKRIAFLVDDREAFIEALGNV